MPQQRPETDPAARCEAPSAQLGGGDRAELTDSVDDLLAAMFAQHATVDETLEQLRAIDPDREVKGPTPTGTEADDQLQELMSNWRAHVPAEARQRWRDSMDRLANRLVGASEMSSSLKAYSDAIEQQLATEREFDRQQAHANEAGRAQRDGSETR